MFVSHFIIQGALDWNHPEAKPRTTTTSVLGDTLPQVAFDALCWETYQPGIDRGSERVTTGRFFQTFELVLLGRNSRVLWIYLDVPGTVPWMDQRWSDQLGKNTPRNTPFTSSWTKTFISKPSWNIQPKMPIIVASMKGVVVEIPPKNTLPETNIAPEKLPFQ